MAESAATPTAAAVGTATTTTTLGDHGTTFVVDVAGFDIIRSSSRCYAWLLYEA